MRPNVRAILAVMVLMTTAIATAQLPTRPSLQHILANGRSQPGTPTGVGNNPFLLIDYPGGIASQYPSGINDKGRIVGLTGFADGSFRGYLLQGKTFKDIVFPGAVSTAAFAINKSGVIVGLYCSDVPCNTSHAYSLKAGVYTSLEFPGGMNTNAYGVNTAGDIVGVYQTPDLFTHGFLLHQGSYTSIDVPGAPYTVPIGINDHGTIVGGDGNGHGFILQNGTFTQIDYPGATGTELEDINNGGDIVGIYTDATDNHNHGFLLSGSVFTPFDVPFPGSISTIPTALNNKHQIVGSYGSYPPAYFFGFLTTY